MHSVRRFLSLALVASSCAVVAQAADMVQASEIVNRVNARYGGLTTLEAEFVEIYRGQVRRGVARFKKPNLFHAKYTDGSGELLMEVTANAKRLDVYLRNIHVVSQQDLTADPNAQYMVNNNPMGFGRLARAYSASYLESRDAVPVVTPAAASAFGLGAALDFTGVHIALYPRDITQGMDHLEWWVDGEGWVRRSRSTTIEGRVIDILFTAYRPGVAISDKEFDYDVPASAQVVKNALLRTEAAGGR